MSDKNKSTDKGSNDTIHSVVRSYSEIEKRIKDLQKTVNMLLIAFDNPNNDGFHKRVINDNRIDIENQIKQLKWVIGQS